MRKDKDFIRDTGTKFKHKDLQKPSRKDRKKHKLIDERDPDAKDTKRDPDLKLAKQLICLAKELVSDKVDDINKFFDGLSKGAKIGSMKKFLEYMLTERQKDAENWIKKYFSKKEKIDEFIQQVKNTSINKIDKSKLEEYKKDRSKLDKFIEKNDKYIDYLIQLIEFYNK